MIYKHRRRNPRGKTVAIYIIVILLLGALAAGLFFLLNKESVPEDNCILLPGKGDGVVSAFADGYLIVDSNLLICVDLSGKTLWQVNLPMSGMNAVRYGEDTIIWGGNYVCRVDKDGLMINAMQEMAGTVTQCAMGRSSYAVVTIEDDQYRLLVFDMAGNEIDNERFPYQTVTKLDYYGSDHSQLWVMSIDSHGTQPITRVSTYQPGKITSGAISSVGELGYYATIRDKMIYLIGTRAASTWEQPNTLVGEKSIYGWQLQSVTQAEKGINCLYSPNNESSDMIPALWYMPASGDDVMMSLPAGCFKGIIADKRIIAVAPQGYYSMSLTGTGMTLHQLNFHVDEVLAEIPGNSFVARSGHTLYLVPLPD